MRRGFPAFRAFSSSVPCTWLARRRPTSSSRTRKRSHDMKTRAISIAAAAALLAGCSVATTVRQNTMAIAGSSDTIRGNTAAIRESTMATTALVPALQGVNERRGPLDSVAALRPTLQGVASLGDPMTRVAALDAPMEAVAGLERPVLRGGALG